jgi:penicillin-binding protein 2
LASGRSGQPRLTRFLPPDPRVEGPYRLTPQLVLRLGILGMLALAVFALLFLRLWSLQVLSGTQYLRAAQNNQLRMVRHEAPRGLILDRNGKVLVGNVTATAVQLWPTDLPEEGRYRMLQRLSRILNVPATKMAAEVDKRRELDPLTPVIVKESVAEDKVRYLSEREREFPGVSVVEMNLRSYPYGAAAAHVLGHVGEITKPQLGLKAYEQLQPGDRIGQAGIEATYDEYLRGQAGRSTMRVDSLGQPRSPLVPSVSPKDGKSIRLTIDADLQLAAERALRIGIERALEDGEWAANGGAIVALDARDGAVLAMASNPTFKPSLLAGRSNQKKLAPLLNRRVAEIANFPGLNRATAGLYPPGSTFKPVTAIAALEEQEALPYESIPCTPSMTYVGENGVHYVFRNWDPFVNTGMDMPTAIARSCDTYFYELGRRFYVLERSPLQEWATTFGYGRRTGIDLAPEEAGLVPTPEWRKRAYTKKTDPCCWEIDRLWKPGDSIQLAIGQKDMLATPLQMARFYALVSNGGRLVTPHLLLDVEGPGNTRVVPRPPRPAPRRIDVDASALSVVRDGLLGATHLADGTSTAIFGSFPVAIAGKTGTAEKIVRLPGFTGLRDQAWWCGYGPADSAEIVVCVVIENGGHGGVAAAPAALEVFEQYFGEEAGAQGTVYSD